MVIFSPLQGPLDLFSGSVFFLNAGQVIISGELFISNFVLFTCIWTHNLQKDKKGGIPLSHQLGKQNIQANIRFITTYLSTLYQKSQFFFRSFREIPHPYESNYSELNFLGGSVSSPIVWCFFKISTGKKKIAMTYTSCTALYFHILRVIHGQWLTFIWFTSLRNRNSLLIPPTQMILFKISWWKQEQYLACDSSQHK